MKLLSFGPGIIHKIGDNGKVELAGFSGPEYNYIKLDYNNNLLFEEVLSLDGILLKEPLNLFD